MCGLKFFVAVGPSIVLLFFGPEATAYRRELLHFATPLEDGGAPAHPGAT